ncbi:mitochondrial outer membrane translocase complex, subunit Tom5 [Amylocarpus encephaloides]|uniref:Mitochondrial outer membrane translocase complex, subunit Tom5 n=1 Tax=Amylocarpus encephaloides TaxID=45428 RepID=A0A9P7YE74_9HELO|nr:mitochondrial outer membrane translocase complex, subunit Tom5 [Amylocarpus encephaloides]
MFGGPPPQLSAAELKAQEQEASLTVQRSLVAAVLLYLSPFAISAVKQLI